MISHKRAKMKNQSLQDDQKPECVAVCVLTHQSGCIQIDVSSPQVTATAHKADSPQEVQCANSLSLSFSLSVCHLLLKLLVLLPFLHVAPLTPSLPLCVYPSPSVAGRHQ